MLLKFNQKFRCRSTVIVHFRFFCLDWTAGSADHIETDSISRPNFAKLWLSRKQRHCRCSSKCTHGLLTIS